VINTPWPKVTSATSALQASLHDLPKTETLFEFLRDETIAEDTALPNTGVSLDWERRLSAIFVRSPAQFGYGTRNSTVLVVTAEGRIIFDEQEWNADAGPGHRQRFSFGFERSD
jgi:uncharacterized protein with NRDE domain